MGTIGEGDTALSETVLLSEKATSGNDTHSDANAGATIKQLVLPSRESTGGPATTPHQFFAKISQRRVLSARSLNATTIAKRLKAEMAKKSEHAMRAIDQYESIISNDLAKLVCHIHLQTANMVCARAITARSCMQNILFCVNAHDKDGMWKNTVEFVKASKALVDVSTETCRIMDNIKHLNKDTITERLLLDPVDESNIDGGGGGDEDDESAKVGGTKPLYMAFGGSDVSDTDSDDEEGCSITHKRTHSQIQTMPDRPSKVRKTMGIQTPGIGRYATRSRHANAGTAWTDKDTTIIRQHILQNAVAIKRWQIYIQRGDSTKIPKEYTLADCYRELGIKLGRTTAAVKYRTYTLGMGIYHPRDQGIRDAFQKLGLLPWRK